MSRAKRAKHGYWILNEENECVHIGDDVQQWARFFESDGRRVASTIIEGVRISTVFLGLDHGFMKDAPPLLFETMIFGGDHDDYQRRCSTFDEAEAMHIKACELVKQMSGRWAREVKNKESSS